MTARKPSLLMLRILRAASAERGALVRDLRTITGSGPEVVSRAIRRLTQRGALALHQPFRLRHPQRRQYTTRVTTTNIGRDLLAANFHPPAGNI